MAILLVLLAGPAPTAGLAVEAVEAGSFAGRAGLRPGDRLERWSRAPRPPESPLPAAGLLAGPFALRSALIAEAPRGALTLYGRRGGVERSWTLLAGASIDRAGLRVHPDLPPDPADLGRDPDTAFAAALGPLAADPTVAADLLARWGWSLDERGLLGPAADRFRRALARLPAAEDGDGLLRARIEHGLAEALRHADDYAGARRFHEAALARRLRLAPASLEAAESLFGLARVLNESGGAGALAESEALLRRADALWSALDPGSLGHARLVDYLGLMIWNQGRIFEAERAFEEAYGWACRWAPDGYEAARALLHWGTSLDRRGDMVRAERALTQALGLWTRLPANRANRFNQATAWWTIAYLKAGQGDLETAEADARRALEIQESLAPSSYGVADALEILGDVETRLGRFAEGRASLRRALGLRQALSPGELREATNLQLLGALELAAGEDLEGAERLLRRADEIQARVGPETLSRADGLATLAEVVFRRGRGAEALALARRTLELRRRFAPGGLPEAESWHQAGLFRRASDPGRSADDLCRAADIVERLGDRLAGATRARATFGAAYGGYFFDCLEARLGQRREAEAFRVLEAGRARALLDLFGARDLDLRELPERFRLERERLYQEYVILSGRLEEAGAAGDPAALETARQELLENQRRHDELASRLRAEVPRLAALQAPRPLDLAAARKVLDPGTVLLAYAVGAGRSFLFAVRSAREGGRGLRVFPLPLGGEELRREVEAFRALAADPGSDRGALRRRGRDLYRRLLEPAEGVLRGARRLLLAPDGALHALPFAALVRADGRYLAQWKPLHTAVSATVYAEVLSRRRARAGGLAAARLGGFGDPALPGGEGARARARGRLESLGALPGAREELAAIGALFAPRARLFVGPEATEAQVAAVSRTVEVLHLATHAILDEAVPLNSALLLAPPPGGAKGADDGRLEVWEIVEKVRLDADLVALSGCETGLGQEMGGEGLLGLTRAFQFAGARSVLASFWAVGDGSTARLLPRFYRRLLAGRPLDEALRGAQLEALADPALSHPSVWAAFALNGDWR